MGIYSVRDNYNASAYLEDVEIEDVFEENLEEAALRHTYENNVNLHNIMRSVGIMELAEYESTGEELIYEAGTASALFDRFKAALKKIWEKIKSLFTKFFAKLQSFGKDDKAFVNKYRKQIMAGSVKDLNYKGYKFTLDGKNNDLFAEKAFSRMKAIKIGSTSTSGALGDFTVDTCFNYGEDSDITKGSNPDSSTYDYKLEDLEDQIEKVRGAAIGDGSSYSSSEYLKELKEKFRDGESSPTTLDDSDIDKGEMVQFLMNTSTLQKEIEKKDFKPIKKKIEDCIKNLDKKSKAFSKIEKPVDKTKVNVGSKNMTVISKCHTVVTNCLTIIEQMEAAKMTAFNDCRKQYKAICVKLIGRKAKNESYGYDDYDYSYGDYSSALESVKLI